MDGVHTRPPAVYLLDADPDLGQHIRAAEHEQARQRAVARVIELDPPSWDAGAVADAASADWLGLFVVDGLLLRRVSVASRNSCELFGRGAVVRPWDQDGEYGPLSVTVDWLVLQPSVLAMLDSDFARRVARWPTISAALIQRIAARARYLSLTSAVTHLPRTHARLLLMFWLLAERWGTVTPEGVVVRLPLTHQLLAMLVGSHRPTVTIALQRLGRDKLIIRQAQNRWLLTTKAVESLRRADSSGISF